MRTRRRRAAAGAPARGGRARARSASASDGVALADRDHGGLLVERADVDVAARLAAQRFERRVEVLIERNLHRDLRDLLRAPDREVADGIRGQLLVRDHEPRVVVRSDERVRQADLLDDALDVVDDDRVAEAERLRERDQDPGDRVAERPLRREADDRARSRRTRRGCRPRPRAPAGSRAAPRARR